MTNPIPVKLLQTHVAHILWAYMSQNDKTNIHITTEIPEANNRFYVFLKILIIQARLSHCIKLPSKTSHAEVVRIGK